MATSTVEDYIKTLYLLQQGAADRWIAMGRLASRMSVTPGTTTTMIKALSESGLVEYKPRGGVRLTSRGHTLALHVLRRHRLVELFLVNVMGLNWTEVHDEAEELEHAISDKVLARMDDMLGHPSVDPHGDPIPNARGKVPRVRMKTLADSPKDRRLKIARILDQRGDFLHLLDRRGLTIGEVVVIDSHDPVADAITLHPENGAAVTIGLGAAAKILVKPLK